VWDWAGIQPWDDDGPQEERATDVCVLDPFYNQSYVGIGNRTHWIVGCRMKLSQVGCRCRKINSHLFQLRLDET